MRSHCHVFHFTNVRLYMLNNNQNHIFSWRLTLIKQSYTRTTWSGPDFSCRPEHSNVCVCDAAVGSSWAEGVVFEDCVYADLHTGCYVTCCSVWGQVMSAYKIFMTVLSALRMLTGTRESAENGEKRWKPGWRYFWPWASFTFHCFILSFSHLFPWSGFLPLVDVSHPIPSLFIVIFRSKSPSKTPYVGLSTVDKCLLHMTCTATDDETCRLHGL